MGKTINNNNNTVIILLLYTNLSQSEFINNLNNKINIAMGKDIKLVEMDIHHLLLKIVK